MNDIKHLSLEWKSMEARIRAVHGFGHILSAKWRSFLISGRGQLVMTGIGTEL